MRLHAGLMMVVMLLAASGCGPVESTAVIMDADAAIAGARTAQADQYAPYEFTSAELYLEKAREERGYADFETSIDYARKAREMARQAQAAAMKKVKEEGEDASSGTPMAPFDDNVAVPLP